MPARVPATWEDYGGFCSLLCLTTRQPTFYNKNAHLLFKWTLLNAGLMETSGVEAGPVSQSSTLGKPRGKMDTDFPNVTQPVGASAHTWFPVRLGAQLSSSYFLEGQKSHH